MLKQELRQKYLSHRNAFSENEKMEFEKLIFENIQKIDFHKFSYVHIFLPIAKFNEINTFSAIDYLNDNYPHLKIVVPKLIKNDLKMNHILYLGKDHLSINSWGIPEPNNNDLVDPKRIDMIFVPLVIADKKGNRVGYGKGFYDYFLKEVSLECKKVGLSYFDPIDLITDRYINDVKLDILITPKEIIYFEKP